MYIFITRKRQDQSSSEFLTVPVRKKDEMTDGYIIKKQQKRNPNSNKTNKQMNKQTNKKKHNKQAKKCKKQHSKSDLSVPTQLKCK